MVPIDTALAGLRISGAILLRERYAHGTVIRIPDERRLRAILGYDKRMKVAPFHLVRRGALALAPSSGQRLALGVNDVAICLDGGAHDLAFGRPAQIVRLEDILAAPDRPAVGAGDGPNELICGVFGISTLPLSPLLATLPGIVCCSTAGEGAAALFARVCDMLSLALDTPSRAEDRFTCVRLLEMFFAEAIRTHSAAVGAPPGWLSHARDAKLAAALSALHRDLGAEWSVVRLAAVASLSPSRFAAKFRAAFGMPVMDYVAQRRIEAACSRMENTSDTLDQVAYDVGYGSGAALSKAFKAYLGFSPREWRAQLATPGARPQGKCARTA